MPTQWSGPRLRCAPEWNSAFRAKKATGWDIAHLRGIRHRSGSRCLEGGFTAFVVADADGFVDAADEDFPVADAAGAGGADDGLNGLLLHVFDDDQLDFDFGQEVDGVFTAAVELGVALLAAMAAGF